MGGHGHHPAPVIKSVINYEIPEAAHAVENFKSPDWRKYKVESAPELVAVKNRLAAKGLKDPWLRNEVWRFDPACGAVPNRTALFRHASQGMKWGFILCVGTVLLETAYKKAFGSDDHHGHGHAHH